MKLSQSIARYSLGAAAFFLLLVVTMAVAHGRTGEPPAAFETPAEIVVLHAVISENGRDIASPFVELVPGIVADVVVADPRGQGLRLFLGASGTLRTAAGVEYVQLEIWSEAANATESSSEAAINMSSMGIALGQSGSLTLATEDGRTLSVVAAAAVRPASAGELARVGSCDGEAAASTVGKASRASKACCSASCPNRPGFIMTCCGAVTCCDGVCGACCTPGGTGGGGPPGQEP